MLELGPQTGYRARKTGVHGRGEASDVVRNICKARCLPQSQPWGNDSHTVPLPVGQLT